MFLRIFSIVVFLHVGCTIHAATLGVISNFESSTNDGWEHPVSTPNQTMIQGDGPFNNVLFVSSSGGMGAGSRLVVPNDSTDWIGNYTAAGISAIAMDLVNNSSITLDMRIAIAGASGNRWVSTTPLTLARSDRGTFRFELNNSTMSAAGGSDLTAALANITQIRILHNSSPNDFKGSIVNGSFTVDNITLVPEPSTSMMSMIGFLTVIMARHRQTQT